MRFTWIIAALVAFTAVECNSNVSVTSIESQIEAKEIQHVLALIIQMDEHGNDAYIMEKVGRWIENAGKQAAVIGRAIQVIGETMVDVGRWMQSKNRPQGFEPAMVDTTFGWKKTWKKIRRGAEKAGKVIGKAVISKKIGEIIASTVVYRIEKFEALNPVVSEENVVNFAKSLQVLGAHLQNAGQDLGKLTPEVMQRIHNSTAVKVHASQFMQNIANEF